VTDEVDFDDFDVLIASAPEPTFGEDPDDFFDGQQLLAQTLARAVQAEVLIARLEMQRDTIENDALWFFDRCGVWRNGGRRKVEWACNRLLGERVRGSYIDTAMIAVRNAENMPNLSDAEPHPHLLNFTNGMLDWAVDADDKGWGFTQGHHPDHYSTVQLGVVWNPNATCPVFDTWVKEMLPEDCVDYIDEIIGYIMLNGNPLQKAILLHGSGRNGKGTFLRILKDIIGVSNCSSISLQQMCDNRFAPASLHMKLANIAGDIHGGRIEQTNIFKMVTGGDPIQMERKNQQPFMYTVWAVPLFSANKIPTSSDTSVGYINRWEVIPFLQDLTKKEGGPNPTIENEIRGVGLSSLAAGGAGGELEGIAARGVRGLRRLMARGHFERPASVQDEFKKFVEALDPVRTWISECCDIIGETDVVGKDTPWTERTVLHLEHAAWRKKNDLAPMSAKAFYERLEMAGFKAAQRTVVGKTSKQRVYLGIQIVDSGIQVGAESLGWAAAQSPGYDVNI
jgi:putative DNA primase/helicase